LASNDVVEILFDEPDRVPWERANRLVTALEAVLRDAVVTVLAGTERREGATENLNDMTARAVIAAPIRRGSIILPLTFELLPAHFEIIQVAVAPRDGTDWRDTLGTVADTAGLLSMAVALVFGAHGVLAKLKALSTRPETPADHVVDWLAEKNREVTARWIEAIMTDAERTGCRSVRIRYRDELDIELVRHDRARSSANLGVPDPRPAVLGEGGILQFARSGDVINVDYGAEVAPAFMARLQTGDFGPVVVVWKSLRTPTPPEGLWYDGRGEYVSRTDVTPLEDVPPRFMQANGVFVVRAARQASFE
jgi:hypothetical protein